MSNNSVKPLYYAASLDELKQKSEVKMHSLDSTRCRKYMHAMNEKASNYRRAKDEELEYMCTYRYLLLVSKAAKELNVSKKSNIWLKELEIAKFNENRLECLESKLQARYQKLNENKTPPQSCITIYPAEKSLESNTNSTKEVKTLYKKKHCEEIGCFDLHKLLIGDVKDTFLIMDVRPPGSFEESHIDHKNVLNVSTDKLARGMSASNLGQKFTDKESQELWKMRMNVNKLILMDGTNSLDTLPEGSPLHQLKEILVKWDPQRNNNCFPMILEGGYDEFLFRYPQVTTNPKVARSSDIITPCNSFPILDYPMEELDPEKEKVIVEATPTKLFVDRSHKPQRFINESKDSFGDTLSNKSDSMDLKAILTMKEDNVETIQDEIQTVKVPLKEPSTSPKDVDARKSGDKDIRKQLKELRKVKPQSSSTSSTPLEELTKKDDSSDSEGGIYTSPKKDGGLKRSSSSPNIAQLKDDYTYLTKHPAFTRANKPSSISSHRTYGERTDSTYGTTSAGLTGLKNISNNCYMNSILQCLNNTVPLVKELTALNNKLTFNHQSRSRGRVAQEVIDAFRNMWSGDIRVYSIKDLKEVMGEIKDIFKGAAHQDSNEFLIILLEHLHEDLKKPEINSILDGADVESGERAWGEFKRKNSSIIQSLFYGQQKSTVTCSTCSHSSVTFEQFFNLFVPIPSNQSAASLNDCIQLYMSGERISGWKCPKCNVERNATKKFDISRLPPILVIALKRFTQNDDSWLQKKENVVHYPLENLDMSRFTVTGSEQRYSRYSLYAMSIHSGTLKSGHYRAICKNYKNQNWYLYDDSVVEQLQVFNVKNNPEVYILFYSAESA